VPGDEPVFGRAAGYDGRQYVVASGRLFMSDSSPVPTPPGGLNAADRPIVVYSRDLFFGMRIRTVVGQLGYAAVTFTAVSAFADRAIAGEPAPALALVDFNQPVDWAELRPVIDAGLPVVAFGAHTDVDGFRAAKAAGVARVVSNGDLSRSLPELVARYARS
jgi:hypothetical protein